MLASGHRHLVGVMRGDKNVLKLDCGDAGIPRVSLLKITELIKASELYVCKLYVNSLQQFM